MQRGWTAYWPVLRAPWRWGCGFTGGRNQSRRILAHRPRGGCRLVCKGSGRAACNDRLPDMPHAGEQRRGGDQHACGDHVAVAEIGGDELEGQHEGPDCERSASIPAPAKMTFICLSPDRNVAALKNQAKVAINVNNFLHRRKWGNETPPASLPWRGRGPISAPSGLRAGASAAPCGTTSF